MIQENIRKEILKRLHDAEDEHSVRILYACESVEKLHKSHKKQLLTYLKLKGCKLGLLLNFGESLMKDGISRVINGEIA